MCFVGEDLEMEIKGRKGGRTQYFILDSQKI